MRTGTFDDRGKLAVRPATAALTNCVGLRQLVKFKNAWWSWSDSNQPPECYGIWACPTSSPGRTPGLELEEARC